MAKAIFLIFLSLCVSSITVTEARPRRRFNFTDISLHLERRATSELDACQVNLAFQFTSYQENDTPVLQYDYIENDHDGNGLTGGFAGLCSGTGDMYAFLSEYAKKHHTCFDKSIATLKHLNDLLNNGDDSSSTSALLSQGFVNCWKSQSKTKVFQQAYYNFVYSFYYLGSQEYAAKAGLTIPIGRAFFYDAFIQHGNGQCGDGDSMDSLVCETIAKHGKATPETQYAWILEFNGVRRADLLHSADPTSRYVWMQSLSRVDSLDYTIATTQNWELTSPYYALGANWEQVVIQCPGPNYKPHLSPIPPKLNKKLIKFPLTYPTKRTTRAPGLKNGINPNNDNGIVIN